MWLMVILEGGRESLRVRVLPSQVKADLADRFPHNKGEKSVEYFSAYIVEIAASNTKKMDSNDGNVHMLYAETRFQ